MAAVDTLPYDTQIKFILKPLIPISKNVFPYLEMLQNNRFPDPIIFTKVNKPEIPKDQQNSSKQWLFADRNLQTAADIKIPFT